MERPQKRRPRSSQPHDAGRKDKFLIEYRKWGRRSRALTEADITLGMLKKWVAEDPVFAAKFQELSTELDLTTTEDLMEAGLSRALARSDFLLKVFLQRYDPTFRDKQEVEHAGKVTVTFRENFTTEDL